MLLNYLESSINEAISILNELVSIRTCVPPGENYEEAIDFTARFLKKLGFRVEKIFLSRELFEEKNPRLSHLSGERVNLSAFMDIGAEKTLLINTHLDVVPAGSNWSVEPFKVTVKNKRIFGRGVSDSKGSVAALLTLLSALKELNIKPKYNLNIAFTTDEEMGPYSGLCYLADIGKLNADYFLSMDGNINDITIASNGNVDWQIDVFGKAVHSGSSFLGVNAIEKAITVMNELMKLKADVEKKRSKVPVGEVIRKKTGIKTLIPVLNINIIHAGVKQNIIPDRCTIKGDRRFIPEEDFNQVCNELRDAISKAKEKDPELSLELICNEVYSPFLTDINHPWIKEVQKVASEVTGREVKLTGTQGSLDVAYAVKVTSLPACCFGVGRRTESNAHGDDENIRISDFITYMKFLGRLIAEF